MIRFTVLTIFPEIIENYTTSSILGRAQKSEAVTISARNLRDWTTDKHHTVDDKVFGGGPGMLMKVEPLYLALKALRLNAISDGFSPYVFITTATGNLFSQDRAEKMASATKNTEYIIICGHYEGFDARIMNFVDEELTVGPYVLTGGELPALIAIDAVTRLLPNVLGNNQSAKDETTFVQKDQTISVDGEHPQYTMPASFTYITDSGEVKTLDVPEILRSGHHQKIVSENLSQRKKRTLVTSA
jgi:tRNA (guanine37-N1)-methyltransferase